MSTAAHIRQDAGISGEIRSMYSLNLLRARGVAACAVFTLAAVMLLVVSSQANAAYTVPTFSVTAAPAQAAGHPKLTISIDPDAANADSSGGDDLRDLSITAPPGLQFNQAAATTKCTSTQLAADKCPPASVVGTVSVKWRRSSISSVTMTGQVYVMTTPSGANTASLGFMTRATGYKKLSFTGAVSNALPVAQPTSVSFTLIPRQIQSSFGTKLNATIDKIDLVLNAKANSSQSGPYFTLNPSSCTAATTQATLTSYANVVVGKSSSFLPTGCGTVAYAPVAAVSPTDSLVGSATGMNSTFTISTADATTQSSVTKSIQITPVHGTALNQPAIDAVAATCSDAQLASDTCPSGSKVGTASFVFPAALPAWGGDIYLLSRSGTQLRLGGIARGAGGAVATILGTATAVDLDADTALDTVRILWDQLPNVPWSSASLNITSQLLRNGCTTGGSTTTLQSASSATLVKVNPWANGDCPMPDTTIPNPPPANIATSTPSIAFTANLPDSTFECSWDDQSYTPCTSPATSAPLPDGFHRFCVRAIGRTGPDLTPACTSFIVDTTPPTVTIHSGGPAIYFSVEASSTDVTCELNSDAPVSCSSPWVIAIADNVSYEVRICATDPAGNVGCGNAAFEAIELETTITDGPSARTSSTSAVFSFESNNATSSFTCKLDGGGETDCASAFEVTGLSDGAHSFCVYATNSGGVIDISPDCRTWTVDTIPPAIGPLSLSQSNSPGPATLTYTASDNDGSAPSCTPPSGSTVTLVAGANTINVTCQDALGNVSTRTLQIVITLPPFSVSITGGPSGLITDPAVSFSYQTSEPVYLPNPCYPENVVCIQVIVDKVALTCTLDGTSVGCPLSSLYGGTFSTTVNPGAHTFCVSGRRLADNRVSTACRSFEYVPVPDPPQITGGPSGYVASTSASFSFTGAQPGDVYECQRDALPWAPCVSPFNLNTLGQGFHSFCVRTVNAAGTSSPVCRTWRVDTLVPQVEITSPTGDTPSTSLSFTWTIVDAQPIVSVTCEFDGGPKDSCSSPWLLSGISSGSHTVTICATDAAGNIGCAPFTWTRIEPPAAPIILSSPTSTSPTNSARITFRPAGEDSTSDECRMDSGAWVTCTSPVYYSGLAEGAHQFCVRGVNVAGPGPAACTSWTVDTIPPPVPTVTLVSPSSSPSMQTSATISFSNTEPGTGHLASLDGGAYVSAFSPMTLTDLSPGTHVYSVRSRDSAGNTSSTASVTWTISDIVVDYFPYIESGPSGTVGSTTATFTFGGYPPDSSFECQLDGSAWSACIDPMSYAGLSEGEHTFCFRPIDPIGNAYPQACRTWTVDTIPPPLPAVQCNINGTTLACAWTASGAVPPSATCSLDGSPAVACTSPWVVNYVSPGPHSVTICFADATGNTTCQTWTGVPDGGGGGGTTCPPGMVCLPSDPNAPQ
ncbi:MAG: hypothetical protein JHD02_06430 [Thermoleophilaceae bacterium]|nr:hypothetical protein [Thermoleophilaceae bacterium]